jgi:hypothetical protein
MNKFLVAILMVVAVAAFGLFGGSKTFAAALY